MTVAACTLEADDGRARMRRWRALAETAGPVARRIGSVVEVSYPLDAGEELESLVTAERQCCQFVEWDIIRRGEALVLRIAADPERPDDIEAFADLFGAGSGDG
ncbi:MAG TPA: hypothetical protein VGG43_07950 [Acidimicrobiales bacterium]|jgi:hypothetical protein